MTRNRFVLLVLLCTFMLSVMAVQALAQDEEQPEACYDAIEAAMVQLGEVCAPYGAGQACIGNSRVESTFFDEVDEDFFTQPGDIADLSLIDTMTTSPINQNTGNWGVVAFNSQANLPTEVYETLERPGAIYMALGGLTISDATPQEDIIVPLEAGIPMTTLATADLRQSPFELDGEFSNVVSRIPAESTVNADAITPDGDWVRVVHEGLVGWVRSSVVPDSADTSALVEIGPDDFTRMQSINLDLEGDNGRCIGTYQGMVVQGPKDYVVDIAVNSVPIQIQSSVFVMPLRNGHLRVIAFTGAAILFPNNPDLRTIIPAGFMAEFDFNTGQYVTPNPFPNTNITPIFPNLLLRFLNFLSRFKPTNIFHYRPAQLGISYPSLIGPREALITYINVHRVSIVDIFCASGALTPEVCAAYGP